MKVKISHFVTDYYECNEPLLEKAQLSATSSLRERGPENARLDGIHYSYFYFHKH